MASGMRLQRTLTVFAARLYVTRHWPSSSALITKKPSRVTISQAASIDVLNGGTAEHLSV